nr:patatin-like phospholipase family protein [uncultured Ottowia sp.]
MTHKELTQQPQGGGLGLVLSGGGAKGAYQAGVLRALTEEGVVATHVAGASIGALNGALVAAAPTQQAAVEHLQQLWNALAQQSPLQADASAAQRLAQSVPAYVTLLVSFGMTPAALRPLMALLAALRPLGPLVLKAAPVARLAARLPSLPAAWREALQSHLPLLEKLLPGPDAVTGWLSNQPVKALLDEYLPAGGLPARVPLYVSLYPTEDTALDLMKLACAEMGLSQTPDSHFVHVQALPADEQKKALMASAALPLLFTPQAVNGQLYSDGGQGGWATLQGNTPIEPLLQAGCRAVVVTHLEDGSLWSRRSFAQQAEIIEIRPSGIRRKGRVRDVLGFDNRLIADWMEQGWQDTRACLGRIRDVLQAHAALHASARARDAALAQGGQQQLHEAMQRLQEQTRKP